MYIIHTLQCSHTVIVTVCLGLDEFEYTTLKLVSLYPTVYRSIFNQELCCYVPLASQFKYTLLTDCLRGGSFESMRLYFSREVSLSKERTILCRFNSLLWRASSVLMGMSLV